jgi:hypothetical protein
MNQGTPAIYQIHQGTRGVYRGILADEVLSPEEHNHLIQEARERNRANAALVAGATALIGAPGTIADIPLLITTPAGTTAAPARVNGGPVAQQTT